MMTKNQTDFMIKKIMTGDIYMKRKAIAIISLFTLLLVGCTNNNKEDTTTSTQPIDQKEKTSSSFTSQSTTSPTVDSTTSEELTDIDEEKANEIAEIIVNDFKKQITATFEDKDDSSSWGSTISITFNEDGSLKMTESDNSFQKIDLTYEGTYSINNNAIASNILEHIRSRGIAEKEIKIKEALNISSYEDYVAFSNTKIPVDIDCTINGFMSKEIKDEEMKTQAEFEYRNFKLILSPQTYLFKKATQLSLTKI